MIFLTSNVQKSRVIGRICPQMAEDATGRCWGPRGADYPVTGNPPTNQTSPSAQHLRTVLCILLCVADIKRFFIRGISAGLLTSQTHSNTRLHRLFAHSLQKSSLSSRSLSFYTPILIFNKFLSREILASGSAKRISKCGLSFVFLS